MTVSKKSMKWIPWILILPVVIIRGFTTLYPILVTIKNSFYDIKILAGVDEFVGLANYINVFKDAKVQTSVVFYGYFCSGIYVFPYPSGSGSGYDPEYEIQGTAFSEDHCPDPLGYAHSSGRHGGKVGL